MALAAPRKSDFDALPNMETLAAASRSLLCPRSGGVGNVTGDPEFDPSGIPGTVSARQATPMIGTMITEIWHRAGALVRRWRRVIPTHRPRSTRWVVRLTVAALGIAAYIGAPAAGVGVGLADDVVSVSGNRLSLDGRPFQVHGVELDATVAPPDWLASAGLLVYRRAYEHFVSAGRRELAYARTYFGANTIEFKVSQPGFDVEDPAFPPAQHAAYIAEIKNAVALARGMGFVVILADLNTRIAGNTRPMDFPDAGTARVDTALAEIFKHDRGVIIDIYNEPWPENRRRSPSRLWHEHIAGGSGRSGHAQVGVQQIVNRMRATGALNLILVQPYFHFGFVAYPGGLTDPGGNLAFGIHPYLQEVGLTVPQWDAYFGRFALTHPVVATEWSQNAGPLGPLGFSWCTGPAALNIPLQLLRYLKQQGINGVVGWAFDIPWSLLESYEGSATTMRACGMPKNNVGEWLKAYFAGALP
jgi:hypothetical protein